MAAVTLGVAGPGRARQRLLRALHYGAVVLLIFLLLTPLLAFLFNAFSFRWFYPQLFPNELTMRAWESTFAANSKVPEALLTSTILAVGVTLSSVIIGLPAARALGLYSFRGKRVIEFLIISPTIVPGIAVAMGLNINFIRWGLSGNLLGVGLVHLVPVMPYVVLVLSGVFANYNPEFEQQARLAGRGHAGDILLCHVTGRFPWHCRGEPVRLFDLLEPVHPDFPCGRRAGYYHARAAILDCFRDQQRINRGHVAGLRRALNPDSDSDGALSLRQVERLRRIRTDLSRPPAMAPSESQRHRCTATYVMQLLNQCKCMLFYHRGHRVMVKAHRGNCIWHLTLHSIVCRSTFHLTFVAARSHC